MSQPSLSRNIQEIERRVGVLLFERGTGGVVPTDAGRLFLEHAREVAARSADLNREMDLLRGLEKGELNIGSGTYPSATIVDGAVVRLLRAHPAVRLQIQNNNWSHLLLQLLKRELDLAVVAAATIENETELHVTKLNQHQGYFVVRGGHPLLMVRGVLTLQSVLQFPLVSASRIPTSILRPFLIDEIKKNANKSSPKSLPTIACESVAMMKRIAAETDAVSLLPLNVVSSELRNGELALLPLVPPSLKVDLVIIRLAHRSLSPLGETFVRLLQEVDAELLEFEQKNAQRFLARPSRARSIRSVKTS
jgi:DNA-binding transcriptional LysR family regulator